MKLNELLKCIQHELDQDPYAGEKEVKVLISVPSIGPSPSVGVNDACIGIDWDSQQFLIHPNIKLVPKDNIADEHESMKREIMDYLFDRRDKVPTYQTKRFLKSLKEIPSWFRGKSEKS